MEGNDSRTHQDSTNGTADDAHHNADDCKVDGWAGGPDDGVDCRGHEGVDRTEVRPCNRYDLFLPSISVLSICLRSRPRERNALPGPRSVLPSERLC